MFGANFRKKMVNHRGFPFIKCLLTLFFKVFVVFLRFSSNYQQCFYLFFSSQSNIISDSALRLEPIKYIQHFVQIPNFFEVLPKNDSFFIEILDKNKL
jgi:hypothetical protein